MHANYLLNKTHQAITIRCMQVIYETKLTKRPKYGACKLFIKQNLPIHENTGHPNYLLNQNSQRDQNTLHASY